jgi:NAD(P)-dependent dehydrogenase (short-subunit alcohol dehydrogenase family)
MADAGKVVVVTGAGSGLGRSCAQALLDDGFHVVLVGRRRELVDQVAHPWSGTWGRVDVLVNNAGTSGGVAEIDLDDCRTTVEVNHRRAPVHPAGVRRDAASGAARWAHHQQRLDGGARPAAEQRRLHGHEARGHGADPVPGAGRPCP